MKDLIEAIRVWLAWEKEAKIGTQLSREASAAIAAEAKAAIGTAALALGFFETLALFLSPAAVANIPRIFSDRYGRWLDNSRGLIGNALFDIVFPVVYLIGTFTGVVRSLLGQIEYESGSFVRYYQREYRMERFDTSGILTLFRKNIAPTEILKENLASLGWQDAEMDALLRTAYETPGAGEILQGLLRGNYDEPYARTRLRELGLREEDQTLLVSLTHAEFTIDQLLTMRLKGYMKSDEFFYAFGQRLGYDKGQLDILEQSNGEPISVGQALDLWNKKEGADLAISLGVANDVEIAWSKGKGVDDVDRAVLEGPLNNYWFDAIKLLRYNMLGAPDYIRFAVRDVYDTVKRALYKLDEDYPEIVGAKLRMLGYSPQDAKDAWAAHWDLPSPTQVFEMLHRNKLPAGITVDDFLKSADYAPAWRQALADISYNPITRTDAKRMYKLRGDLDELIRHFKDNGYNEADAKDLAEFTRQDVNIEGNNEKRGLSSGLKNAVLSMYKGRTISVDEVRSILRELTYTDETIEQFILEADFFRIQDEKADIAGALKTAYVKALRSREDTIGLLGMSGWRGQPLDDLMATWDLLRAATELQPHQVASRDLTKAELVSAFREEIITDEQLMDALMQLGYDHDESTVIIRLATLSMEKARRNDQIEVVHQSFLAGALDVSTTSLELEKISVPYLQKNNLISKWRYELAKRIPDFTLTQLEGMIKAKVMDEAAAQKYLADQGYSQEQQTYLLSWWLGKRQPLPGTTKTTKLSRKDIESIYINDKGKRSTSHDALISLGYSESEVAFILDSIDKNLKR